MRNFVITQGKFEIVLKLITGTVWCSFRTIFLIFKISDGIRGFSELFHQLLQQFQMTVIPEVTHEPLHIWLFLFLSAALGFRVWV